MDTNMKENNKNELNFDELEQVSGGICGVAIAACVVGVAAAAVKVADLVYDIVMDK